MKLRCLLIDDEPPALKVLQAHIAQISGTEFLRNLSRPPKVIFVTACREYAVDGFELDAVDYLVKPVSFGRFLKADRLMQKIFSFSCDSETIASGRGTE